MRISDWSSDVCSSDLRGGPPEKAAPLLYADRSDRFDASLTSDPALGSSHLHSVHRNIGKESVGSLRLRSAWSRRSEEHTSELQSLLRISYAVFCLKKKNNKHYITHKEQHNQNNTQA